MKRFTLIALALLGFYAHGQQTEGTRKMRGKELTAEQMATLRTKKLTLALDLNEKQQNQIKDLHLEHAREQKKTMDERKGKSRDRDSVSSAEHYDLKVKRLDRMIAHRDKMKEILTVDQFTKWESLNKHKRGERKGHKGKHHRHRKGEK